MNTVHKQSINVDIRLCYYDPMTQKIIGSQLNFASIVEFQSKGQTPCAYLCVEEVREWLVCEEETLKR